MSIAAEIYRISDAYCYFPGITETAGLIAIGEGIRHLGAAGILKVREYYTCQKNIFQGEGNMHIAVGTFALMDGFQKVAPTAGVLLTIYALRGKLLGR